MGAKIGSLELSDGQENKAENDKSGHSVSSGSGHFGIYVCKNKLNTQNKTCLIQCFWEFKLMYDFRNQCGGFTQS